jgi:phenylacetate-CoA ligase
MINFYHSSPIYIQNFLISLYGYYWKNRRFGKGFKEELIAWKAREKYTKEDWVLYQTNELRKLLVYAFENVPYYQRTYTECGFAKNDLQNFELKDLKSLPYLEKDDLRKYGRTELLSIRRKKGKFYASSGSTGTPVSIYISKDFHRKWNAAYEARVRNWAGVNYEMSRGMIGGRKILRDEKSKAPFYRYNSAEKQTYFSAYHISEDNIEEYAKAFKNHKIDYMVGYAMSNYFLASLLLKNNSTVPAIKAVLTSSEKLTQEMREVFHKVYNCKTFDAYSGVEACGLISENQFGDFLFSPDTGIMEVINKQGEDIALGEVGEIVATGLLNFDQPLIRYRIGDRVKLSKDQTTKSGIQMLKVDEIWGRVEDELISEDGKKIVRFHSVFLDIKGLVVGQVIQEDISKITLNIVVDNEYHTSSEGELKKRIHNLLGENVNVTICYLSEIPKNKNGKFQSVISNLL